MVAASSSSSSSGASAFSGSSVTCQSLRASTATATATSAIAAPISPAMRAFYSGAVAGVIADSILHPLDVINLRMKVQQAPTPRYANIFRAVKTILREEGVRGYFGGLGTTLLLSPVCAAVYFGSYETLKAAATPYVSEQNSGFVYFASGAMSEVVISAISVPTEVIKSRLQLGRNPSNASGGAIRYTSNYRNTGHAAMSIVRSEGFRGLYSGYSACLSVDTFFSAFSFLFYETLKSRYKQHIVEQEHSERALTSVESLALGSIAGGSSAFLTNPLDVLTVRLMTQGKNKRYSGVRHCLMETVRHEGVTGLWKGASCRTLAIMPTTGICFGVYETIKDTFFDGELEDFDLDDAL